MTIAIFPPLKDARRLARDPRLDVFRGLGMFIILIAHIPNNVVAEWIPARFGFSDATEIFVFCSGVASAFAFAPVFDRHGWLWGARRILHRIWQVGWAHIGVFVAIVAVLGFVDHAMPGAQYLRDHLNLGHFLDDPAWLLFRFVTLGYVPNYFDILPMYLVILALVPVVMALARRSRLAVAGLCLVLWTGAQLRLLDLPAEPWSDRAWFFNPFAWQAVFFTGFAFARGWLPAPPRDTRLLAAACAVLALCLPFSCQWGFACYAGWGTLPWLGDAHEALAPLLDKTHLGALRYVHFLALAYVTFVLAGEGGEALRGRVAQVCARVGRQTLPVFLSGLVLAQVAGVVLDLAPFTGIQLVVNGIGCAALIGVARLAEAFKAKPSAPAARPLRMEEGRDAPLTVMDPCGPA